MLHKNVKRGAGSTKQYYAQSFEKICTRILRLMFHSTKMAPKYLLRVASFLQVHRLHHFCCEGLCRMGPYCAHSYNFKSLAGSLNETMNVVKPLPSNLGISGDICHLRKKAASQKHEKKITR
jgi:hypothetical protein